ncbi:hypothetical protein HHK36_018051 [Tetracentron sinense]|uniref:Peptidase S8/S53 domain-containing protein n=1 Tax=Tetracentron sinense TaxID=13715 RepID=A0A834YY58_TETSI|nr:hypothetical protein HHK36_018051 [Tetracentron sinense]
MQDFLNKLTRKKMSAKSEARPQLSVTFPISTPKPSDSEIYQNLPFAETDPEPILLPLPGKIVVCYNVDGSSESLFVKQAGAVGIIVVRPLARGIDFSLQIPSTLIERKEAEELREYLENERNPIAKISSTMTALNTKPAPKMATFSSMGPNIISPGIIKPDITTPGVNILAAWPPSTLLATKEDFEYSIISGTSMSCPHASAIAGIIKSYHPSWNPSTIKSAMMTTC